MSPEKPTTSAKENRRTSKPLMEKKRRARINECLVQLKTLVLEAMKKDSSRHSKLEKADILEMTVRHLRNLHRQYLAVAISSDPNIVNKYRAGFNECANEVTRFLNGVEGMDTSIKTNILNHLANSLQNSASNSVLNTASSVGPSHSQQVSLQPVQVQIPTLATIPISPMGLTSNLATLSPTAAAASQSPEPNNNTASATLPAGVTIPDPQTLARMYGGLRFIPGTGEIALVLPNQGHLSSQIPVIPVYANAVTSACSSLAVHSTAAATSSSPAATITSAAASAGSASTSNSTKTNTMISPKNLDSIANNSSSTLTLKLPNFSMGNNLGFMRSAEVASSESSSSSKTIAIPHLRGVNLGKAVDSSMREPAQERPQPQEPERIDELEPVWRPW